MNRWLAPGLVAGVIAAGVAWADWPLEPLPEGARATRVVVRKSERVLEL